MQLHYIFLSISFCLDVITCKVSVFLFLFRMEIDILIEEEIDELCSLIHAYLHFWWPTVRFIYLFYIYEGVAESLYQTIYLDEPCVSWVWRKLRGVIESMNRHLLAFISWFLGTSILGNVSNTFYYIFSETNGIWRCWRWFGDLLRSPRNQGDGTADTPRILGHWKNYFGTK